jgi:hypothetical protein
MVDPSGTRRPVLVSFSGIDGAGKSTQIENLHRHLNAAGFHVQRLAFWDDVAVLRRFREYSRSALLKGDAGIGSPGNPVNRRDKNVQTWYMDAFRFFLYSLDAAKLNLVVRKAIPVWSSLTATSTMSSRTCPCALASPAPIFA